MAKKGPPVAARAGQSSGARITRGETAPGRLKPNSSVALQCPSRNAGAGGRERERTLGRAFYNSAGASEGGSLFARPLGGRELAH